MVRWPVPKAIKSVRGFLGLTGYYRCFIQGYARIAEPLTDLLKKDSFVWFEKAFNSFLELKKVMTTSSVLHYPDFSKTLVVETNACGVGIGAVLMQENHPMAFYSNKLSNRMQSNSTYAKELYAMTQAVCKWQHYLLGRKFVVKTDHASLKNFLSHVIQTPEQQKFLYKLLGFDYTIEYKSEKENLAVDGLSRMYEEEREEEEGLIFALSRPINSLLDSIKKECRNSMSISERGEARRIKVFLVTILQLWRTCYILGVN